MGDGLWGTSSATFESDCDHVRACDVRVTAAGSEFTVTKMGTARITALDEQGKEQKILVQLPHLTIVPLQVVVIVSANYDRGQNAHLQPSE